MAQKKDNRPELLRLLSDCENGKIDFIITKSISRFARNTTDCLEIVRRFTVLSVFILFEKENINTRTADSELVLTILSSLAVEESVSISKNCRWSIRCGSNESTLIPDGADRKRIRVETEKRCDGCPCQLLEGLTGQTTDHLSERIKGYENHKGNATSY